MHQKIAVLAIIAGAALLGFFTFLMLTTGVTPSAQDRLQNVGESKLEGGEISSPPFAPATVRAPDPAEKTVYRSGEYGFAFEYPSSVFALRDFGGSQGQALTAFGLTGVSLVPRTVAEYPGKECVHPETSKEVLCAALNRVSINFFVIQKSFKELAPSLQKNPLFGVSREVTIAGKRGIVAELKTGDTGQVSYYLPLGNAVLNVSRSYGPSADLSLAEQERIFRDILATLKIEP